MVISCFSEWKDETGNIVINLRGNSSRSSLWPPEDFEILNELKYDIELSGNGETIEFEAEGGDIIIRPVSAGLWTVSIEAFYQDKLYARGSNQVTVIPGRDNSVTIEMKNMGLECPDCREVVVKAACTEDGWEEIICEKFEEMHYKYIRTIPQLDHDWSEWIGDGAPTCTTPGTGGERHCKRENCEAEEDGEGQDALGHRNDTWTIITSAGWHDTAANVCSIGEEESICENSGCTHTITRTTNSLCLGTQGLVINNGIVDYDAAHFAMTNVCIPDYRDGIAVTNIGYLAFVGNDGFISGTYNTNLVSVRIGANILSIDGAFFKCHNLTTVTFASDSKLITIGDYAFAECRSLTNIEIPGSVTTIGDGAFLSCASLTSIIIPEEVTFIDVNVFANCTSLTSIEIPQNITSIGPYAFVNTGLTSITIPAGVNFIGHNAFALCTNLTVINVDSNNMNYSSCDNGILFNKDKTILFQAPGAISGSITLPNTVTAIGFFDTAQNIYSAFKDCSNLTEIVIPANVTTINGSAFENCNNLISVIFEPGSQLTNIRWNAFFGCGFSEINIPASVTSIGQGVFLNCINLTAINVDSDNSNFSSDAYGILYNKLKTELIEAPQGISGDVTLPAGVITIRFDAFRYCSSLSSITIPASVTAIGNNAFYNSSSLNTVTFISGDTTFNTSAFPWGTTHLWTVYSTGGAGTYILNGTIWAKQ